MDWLKDWTPEFEEWHYNLIVSIVLIIVLALLNRLALRIVFSKVTDVRDRYFWKNAIKYTFVGIGIIIIGSIWITEVGSIATFIGLVSAGLTIALKDPIMNLAGWLFIIIRRPFEVGDRIQLGNHAGDVIDIRIFQFTVNEIGNWVDADQSTGRIVHIPNGKIFTESQVNYDQGFSHIWNEIGVMVTFESNWQKAKEILINITKKHEAHLSEGAKYRLLEASKKFMIYYNTLNPIVYTKVKESGVMLTMRYICLPTQRRGSEHAIWEEVLLEFARYDDIDFAHPTQRIYYNLKEGKEGARKKRGSV